MEMFVKLGHDLARLEPTSVRSQALNQAGQHPHQRKILVNDVEHTRAQNLDRHMASIMQHGKVDLRNGC